MSDNSIANEFLDSIINLGIQGFGMLPSANKVAEIHAKNALNSEEAINSVIASRSGYASITGFITGTASLVTLPISIPASLFCCYGLGANTASAIALIERLRSRHGCGANFYFIIDLRRGWGRGFY